MPVLLPTVDELRAMPWHSQRYARKRALETLRELLDIDLPPQEPDVVEVPPEPVLPPDPEADLHMAILAAAVYVKPARHAQKWRAA